MFHAIVKRIGCEFLEGLDWSGVLPLTPKERIAGCLLAGALGDSIGACYENQSAAQFTIPTGLCITDDTQLTLATCESIIERRCVDPESIASHMTDWYRRRKITGIGASTLKALVELDAGGHWAMVGAVGERSAGNGAAMRISPLSFFLDPDVASDRQTIRDVARITHRNDEAYLGALSILFTMAEPSLDRTWIANLIEKLPDSRVRDRFVEIVKDDHSAQSLARRYLPTGYVVDSVPFSIMVAVESEDLMKAFQLIIECGGDTDTTSAMFGNIFGAVYGMGEVPDEVVEMVDAYSDVVETATRLARLVEN